VCASATFEAMEFSHISKERLYALMFDSVHLTEEEDAHIAGLRCPECTNAIMELVLNRMTRPKDPDGPTE
jgi:hypothetical protein